MWWTRMPGLLLALGLAVAGSAAAAALSEIVARISGLDPAAGGSRSLVSGIALAVVLGLACRNICGLREVMKPGVAFMATTGLRLGIVLLGFRLALGTAGSITSIAVPVAAACIASALLLVRGLSRLAGVSPTLGALIATGTSICGVTAIVALGPAIKASEDETSYAVACVTVFGLLALFTYPWIAHAAFGWSPLLAGVFLGTSIHDTSQVTGASLIYQEAYGAPLALQAATVTKLLRNMSMAVLLPLIATRFRTGGRRLTLGDVKAAVPGFVLAFLAAIALRTTGDALVASAGAQAAAGWTAFLDGASAVSTWALAAALAGIGLSTDLLRLRALGWRPLLLGLAAALCVGLVSAAGLTLVAALTS
jgi:uncharacterized integral membrane protein (TIGR00698 family)